jgi:hypothetical protein
MRLVSLFAQYIKDLVCIYIKDFMIIIITARVAAVIYMLSCMLHIMSSTCIESCYTAVDFEQHAM